MKFEIKNRIIKLCEKCITIGDNSDYIAEFIFDEEWNGVTKTARFISCNGDYVDQLIKDDKCDIPCDVLKCGYVRIGVYSSQMTTTYCEVYVKESIKEKNGHVVEPTPTVYEQLTKLLDDLYKLMPNEVEQYFENHKDEFKGDKGDKGEAGAIKFIPVTELPSENIDETAIYLKPSSDPDNQNAYDEYIYVNGSWECIGTANVKVDLTDYVKNTDYATSGKAGLVKVWEAGGIGVNNVNGNMYLSPATKTNIDNRSIARSPITVENFDYAVKIGLTANKETLTEEEKTKAQSWLGTPQIELKLKDNGAYTLTINKG